MQNPDQTLIILTPGFPENESDTTCLPAQQIFLKSLRNQYPHVKIVVISFQYPYNNRTYQWHHLKVIPLNGRNRRGIQRAAVWYRVWNELKNQKRKGKLIGILSFWCTECALLGKWFSRFHKVPHYCWILGQDARDENIFVKFIRPQPADLIAMSDFLAREFYRSHGIKPAHVIPNAVGGNHDANLPDQRTIDILGAGSLIPLKQYDLFIEVVAEIKVYRSSVKALICGKGPEHEKLAAQVKKSNLIRNITLQGEVAHPDILKLMNTAKIFLHPSSYEGFSTVCLEALSEGAHVISFCQPMNESIKQWHVVTDKKQMIQKTMEILQDGEIQYESVVPYSIDDTAASVMKLFTKSL